MKLDTPISSKNKSSTFGHPLSAITYNGLNDLLTLFLPSTLKMH